jgi:glycerol-3-phosphate dehydrogenase
MSRRTTVATVALTTTALSTYYLTKPIAAEADPSVNIKRRPGPLWSPPSREQMLKHLKSSGRSLVAPEPPTDFAISEAPTGVESNPTALTAEKKEDEGIFDLLIVGGGATGAGVALDAASRGLKVACVEREDFSSGENDIGIVLEIELIPLRWCIAIDRNFFEINQARTRWCPIPSKGHL